VLWREHLLRPVSYYSMCQKLLYEPGTSPALCVIDHMPNPEKDSERTIEMKRQRTRDYISLVSKEWVERRELSKNLIKPVVEKLDSASLSVNAVGSGRDEILKYPEINRGPDETVLSIKLDDPNIYSEAQDSLLLPLISAENSVEDVKKKIFQLYKIPVNRQRLFHKQQQLVGTEKLPDLEGSDFHLFIVIVVTVRTPAGKKHSVAVRSCQSVDVLREMVMKMENIGICRQRLLHNGDQLGPYSFQNYKIRGNDEIDVYLSESGC
jgi:hypothetical protein